MEEYRSFLLSKGKGYSGVGVDVGPDSISDVLYPFQRKIVAWAVRKGRAAIFADCGLGKTLMQLEWARQIDKPTLILAPLAVCDQTIRESKKLGMDVRYVKRADEMGSGIYISNYERIEALADAPIEALVLDESSILKGMDSSTRRKLMDTYSDVPFKLCCTATPAPNDYMELGHHSEFLNVLTWSEMASAFFVHAPIGKTKRAGWRIKSHGREAFWRWMCSWAIFLRRPSDIGFPDDGYDLPPLEIRGEVVESDVVTPGHLFHMGLSGITDRAKVRRATAEERVKKCAEIVGNNGAQWIVWCGLQSEADEATKRIPGAVQVKGNDSADDKRDRLLDFADGKIRVLVTKPRIAGFGMNFQNCSKMVFLGLSDSYEQYYHSIRRCWRFGQEKPVDVTLVVSDVEREIVDNVQRKEKAAMELAEGMIEHVKDPQRAELEGEEKGLAPITNREASGATWRLVQGDCVEVMAGEPANSVDLSVYSPPFASLYTYSPTEHDMGNCADTDEFFRHFGFFAAELLRLTKPGRLTVCHVSQIPAMKFKDGYIGLHDFRGDVIRAFRDAGWIHHGEVVIDKNPQAQAIRTKAKALLFKQLRKDSAESRQGLADFLLIFRKPGENAVPVKPKISNDVWIKWARPVWGDIRESDTLKYHPARGEGDEKHICPLQLEVSRRAIALWSNPGEVVLSPFAGIGSEGDSALREDRKFFGIELKESYWKIAARNLERAASASGNLL